MNSKQKHAEKKYDFLTGVLPSMLLVLAVFMAYANIYANAFVYDDEVLIVHNQALRNWPHIAAFFMSRLSFDSSYYRPFQTLVYAIIFQIAGLSLFVFHFVNVSLHALNACLVFKLGQKLRFDPVVCCLAALLWALHPLQTEAVTYMSATADTLGASFCLLGVVILLPDFAPRRIAVATVMMICGILTKESAGVFPALAASCLYFQSEKRRAIKTYLCLWPLVAVAVLYVGLRAALMPPHVAIAAKEAMSGVDYAPFLGLLTGLKLLLWPAHLHMGHELPAYFGIWHAPVLIGIAVALFVAIRVICFETRESMPLNWGLLWCAVAYAPGFFVDGFFYEHFLYLPLAGLFLGIAQSLYAETASVKIKKAAVFAALASAGAMGALTYQQNTIWRDPVTFYTAVFAQSESAAKLHGNLGLVYARRGDYENAIAQYRIAIQNSGDTLSSAHVNLAVALMQLPESDQNREEAKNQLQQAVRIDPNCFTAFDDLAILAEQQGDSAQAALYRAQADSIRRVLGITPQMADSMTDKE